MTDRIPPRAINPEGVADGSYALTVAGGKVTGLTAASGGSGSGIVETIVPGAGIAVDSTDPANPVVSATGGGGGGSAETWDEVIAAWSAILPHRWRFDGVGATVDDLVGSLDLTLTGTYTRGAAGVRGNATSLAGDGGAATGGLGSIPIGAAERCIFALYRTAASTSSKQAIVSYGAGSTRQWFGMGINQADVANRFELATWSDDLVLNSTTTSDGEWHLAAIGYSGDRDIYGYLDGDIWARRVGGALNTSSSGNFQVGFSNIAGAPNRLNGVVEEVGVLTSWPGKRGLDRLYRTIAAL